MKLLRCHRQSTKESVETTLFFFRDESIDENKANNAKARTRKHLTKYTF
jgi:hypothetical protein